MSLSPAPEQHRSPGPRPGCDVVCLLLVLYTALLLVLYTALLLVLYTALLLTILALVLYISLNNQ